MFRKMLLAIALSFQLLALVNVALSADNAMITSQSNALTPGALLEDPVEPTDFQRTNGVRELFPAAVQLTKISEGFRSERYHDAAGYCTIAYGHLLKKARCDGSEPKHFLTRISESLGEELLRSDLLGARVAVLSHTKITLTDGQFGALCDFVFNVGATNFSRSTLLKRINERSLASVPAELRRWVIAKGVKWPGLVTRREKEIELFFVGSPIPKTPPTYTNNPPELIDIRSGERP